MKKTLALLFALSLFSCSNDNQVTSNSDTKKEVYTDDPFTSYVSPYDYAPGGAQSHRFLYKFTNTTSLTLSFEPYFGLGGFDGKKDLIFWGTDIGSKWKNEEDSIPNIYYSPNLVLNGNEYGNYVHAERMTLPPHSFDSFGGLGFAVPFVDPTVPGSTPGFNFNYPGSIVRNMERDIISKSGKLYFIKFEVLDENHSAVDSGVLAINAPKSDLFLGRIISPTLLWRFTGVNDSYFNEKMFSHRSTCEIVLPFTSQSIYDNKYKIGIGSSAYEVGIRTDSDTVEIYLEQVN